MLDQRHLAAPGPSRHRAGGKGETRVLLGLAAVAVLGWYFLSPSDPPDRKAGSSADLDREMAAQVGGRADAGAGGPDSGRGDLARAVIEDLRGQGNIDLAQVYERAERFRELGLLADAYLLHFFAARLGHAPSALALGLMYDPEKFSRQASILERADLAQAHKWYLVAANAGDAAAKRHLADLRARAEQAAARGDEEASRLVLQWR